MATKAVIELMMDESGAVTGLRAFDAQLQKTGQSAKALDSNLRVVGGTASQAGAKMSAGMQQAHGHTLSNLDSVRLLRDEFGIHIPRAMEILLSKSDLAMKVIGGLGGAMAGIGFASIAVAGIEQITETVGKLWHNVLDVNAAMKDYTAEAQKAKETDFVNTKSLDATVARIGEAQRRVEAFRAEAERHREMAGEGWDNRNPFQAIHQMWWANNAQGSQLEAQRQLDVFQKQREPEQRHQMNLLEIEAAHAADARLLGEQKITAELQKQLDIDRENSRYTAETEGAYGNPTGRGGTRSQRLISSLRHGDYLTELSAQKAAEAERANLARETSEQVIRLQAQAQAAELSGIARLESERKAADAEWLRAHRGNVAGVKKIDDKFYADEKAMREDQARQTAELQHRAEQVGLTGYAKIQNEGDYQLQSLDRVKGLDPAEKEKQRAAIKRTTDAEILQQQATFAEEMQQVTDQYTNHEIGGFAAIQSAADREIAALTKKFDDAHKSMDLTKPGAQKLLDDDTAALGAAQTAIQGDAEKKKRDLREKGAQDTAQIEDQARIHALTAEKQFTAALQAEYDERLRQAEEARKRDEIDDDGYNRRLVAAAAERDAEIAAHQRELRDKIAGELSRIMRNPVEGLKDFGEQQASKFAADMFLQHGGKMRDALMGGASQSGDMGEHLGMPKKGGLFGGIFGQHEQIEKRETPAHQAVQAGTFTIQSAVIHISGTASISSPVGSSRSGGRSGGGSMPWAGGPMSTDAVGSAASGGQTSDYAGGAAGVPSGAMTSDGFTGSYSSSGSTSELEQLGGGAASGTNSGNGILGDVNSGMSLYKQANSIWGSKGAKGIPGFSTGSGDGSDYDALVGDTGPNANAGAAASGAGGYGGMLQGGGVGANAMGAIGGAAGLFSAYEGNGGVSGALSGAMSGMEFGMAVGGPIGAAIGAVGGAILGAIGFGGREKARVYWLKQGRPRLEGDIDTFEHGGADFLSTYSDIESLQTDAKKQTNALGPAASAYYQDTIKGEISRAEEKLKREQRAGRTASTVSAAQFAVGSDAVPRDGFAFIHARERIMPSDQNERITRAIEANASAQNVVDMYRTTMQTASQQRSAAGTRSYGGPDVHIHAIDTQSFVDRLDEVRGHVRRIYNDSQDDYGGMADG